MLEDRRTNFEKLDDAGLVTDVIFEKFQDKLNSMSPELVDEIIKAFNAEVNSEAGGARSQTR